MAFRMMLHKIGVKLKFSGQVSSSGTGQAECPPWPGAQPSHSFWQLSPCPGRSLSCAWLGQTTISLYPFITRGRSQRLSKSRTSSSEIHKLSFAASVWWTGRVSLLSRSNRPPQSHANNPHIWGMLRVMRDLTIHVWYLRTVEWRINLFWNSVLSHYILLSVLCSGNPPTKLLSLTNDRQWSILSAQWNTNK